MYLIIALLSPLFYGLTNLLDEKMEKKMGGKPWVVTFYTLFTSIIFTLAVAWYFRVGLPPTESYPYLIAISLVTILYLVPYYKSLELADTSVVTSLFSLNRVFVLILSYIILGESLTQVQFLGFILIVIACFLLTFDWRKHHPTKVLYLMGLSAFLLACEGIIFKLALENISWYELFVWVGAMLFILNFLQLVLPKTRTQIYSHLGCYFKNIKWFLVSEFTSVIAYLAYIFSLSKMNLLLFKSIEGLQAIFVLIVAVISHKFFNIKLHEDDHLKNIEWKLLWFTVIFLGVVLVVWFEK